MIAGFEFIVILVLLYVVWRQGGHTVSLANIEVKIEALALKVEKLVKK